MNSYNNTRNSIIIEILFNITSINENNYITKLKKRSRDDRLNKTINNNDNNKSKFSKEERR